MCVGEGMKYNHPSLSASSIDLLPHSVYELLRVSVELCWQSSLFVSLSVSVRFYQSDWPWRLAQVEMKVRIASVSTWVLNSGLIGASGLGFFHLRFRARLELETAASNVRNRGGETVILLSTSRNHSRWSWREYSSCPSPQRVWWRPWCWVHFSANQCNCPRKLNALYSRPAQTTQRIILCI